MEQNWSSDTLGSRKVLVLYLDRPGSTTGSGGGLCGRFGYSDLKEAALRVGLCIFYLAEVLRMAWLGVLRVSSFDCGRGVCRAKCF
jgi:hypothetical protein